MKAVTILLLTAFVAGICFAQESQDANPPNPQGAAPVSVSSMDQLEKYLQDETDNNRFSGAVLIAKDGEILFQQAYGFASKRFKVPNNVDTKFNLGSINKLFTEVAVFQLAEKGELSLDAPIGNYLDMFPPKIAEKVTIKHLLQMNSGWGDYWDNEYFLAHRDELRTVSDYMEFIKDIPLEFEPGADVQHCNTGFEVAGAVIEKVTGVDYYQYIKKNIYEPLGMSNTDSYHRDSMVENLAMGYTNMNPFDSGGTDYAWSNEHVMPPRGTPAGGGYSTVEDLLKFDRGLRSYKLLSEAYTNYLINGMQGNLGDPILPMLLKGVWRGVGGAPGISAVLGVDLKNGYSYIVLSNYDFPVAYDIFQAVYKLKP